jgi:hypothetical protein
VFAGVRCVGGLKRIALRQREVVEVDKDPDPFFLGRMPGRFRLGRRIRRET